MQTISSDKGVVAMPTIPINEQTLLMLEKLYRPLVITPDTQMNAIMFNAGQQAVIRTLRMHYENASR